MRWEGFIDPDGVHKAIEVLQKPGGVFEARVLGGSKKNIFSGYFRDADTLLNELNSIDIRGKNIYVTLQDVKEDCFARSQSEHFERNPSTTSDAEIDGYRWLFVDLFPVRPTGISSTDEELQKAKDLCYEVYAYLQDMGFPAPVMAMSGNGYHLLYRVDVPNDKAGRQLVERCLKVLSNIFDNDSVKIDTTNCNQSRICKLHGTLAQKGTSTKKRPHRMSGLLSVPDPIVITDRSVLQKLAEELPEEPEVAPRQRSRSEVRQEFDLLRFLSDAGLTYSEQVSDRSKIFRLDRCPFDSSHVNGDAKIFWYPDGKIAFKCHHNSCRQYRWQDVRQKYDPDYNQDFDNWDRYDDGWKEHQKQKEADPDPEEQHEVVQPKKKKKKPSKKLKTAEGLLQRDIPEPVVIIGVGSELPLLVEGTCILSAKPKMGKSWFALAMCIAVANGDDFLGYKTRQCSTLYLDLGAGEALQQRRLKRFLHGKPVPKKFYLDTETYNLDDGFADLVEDYLKQDPDIGLIVVDVFQIIRTQAKSMKETEYEHAYRDIAPLNELAQKHHISIILVCHDRKAVDPDDPFSNILGSTGLQGAASQMIVMFRRKKDDPIHISVKGKTIDGLPELNVKLENAEWSIVEGVSAADREQAEAMQEYLQSDIRAAVLKILEQQKMWRGRCTPLIEDSVLAGVPIIETPKAVGGFLSKHIGRFAKVDKVEITIIRNGESGRIYKIQNLPVIPVMDTSDEWIPIEENPVNMGLPEEFF